MIQYITLTSQGTWGRGDTQQAADKAAGVRKRGMKALRYINTFEDPSVFTENDLDFRKNGGLTYTGYKVGDPFLPWVTQYGSVICKGKLSKIL